MMEKARHMNDAEYVPQTYEDYKNFFIFAEAVWNIPEIPHTKPICQPYAEDYGPGRHAKKEFSAETCGYDYLFAELCRDNNAEKNRVRNRRRADRNHPENKAERNREKQNRNCRMYGREEQWAKFRFNPEDPQWCRGGWYWSENREGQKDPRNPEMDIYRNRKRDDREKFLRNDWDAEIEEIIDDIDWAFWDVEYLEEQITMLERNLHVGDNYVRWNRLCERLNVVNDVIRKNRFVEEMI